MKALLMGILALVGLTVASSLQSLPDTAVAEPLRLLLEVTKRSRELAYDLEKQLASNLKDERRANTEFGSGLDKLAAVTYNLTSLTAQAKVALPEGSLPSSWFEWTGLIAGMVGLVTALLNLICSFCLVRSLLYLKDERKRLAYTRARLEESWTALGLAEKGAGAIIRGGARSLTQ